MWSNRYDNHLSRQFMSDKTIPTYSTNQAYNTRYLTSTETVVSVRRWIGPPCACPAIASGRRRALRRARTSDKEVSERGIGGRHRARGGEGSRAVGNASAAAAPPSWPVPNRGGLRRLHPFLCHIASPYLPRLPLLPRPTTPRPPTPPRRTTSPPHRSPFPSYGEQSSIFLPPSHLSTLILLPRSTKTVPHFFSSLCLLVILIVARHFWGCSIADGCGQ